MATIYIPIPITDSAAAAGSNPAKTGLSPAILAGYLLATPATAVSPLSYPAIVAGGAGNTGANGVYVASYDPEAHGEAIFQVDAGSALTANADRFFYLIFTRDSGRIAAGFNGTGQLAPAAVDTIVAEAGINLRQALALILAADAGVVAGAAGSPITIKGAGVGATRIQAVVDAFGNRPTMTLTPPA